MKTDVDVGSHQPTRLLLERQPPPTCKQQNLRISAARTGHTLLLVLTPHQLPHLSTPASRHPPPRTGTPGSTPALHACPCGSYRPRCGTVPPGCPASGGSTDYSGRKSPTRAGCAPHAAPPSARPGSHKCGVVNTGRVRVLVVPLPHRHCLLRASCSATVSSPSVTQVWSGFHRTPMPAHSAPRREGRMQCDASCCSLQVLPPSLRPDTSCVACNMAVLPKQAAPLPHSSPSRPLAV